MDELTDIEMTNAECTFVPDNFYSSLKALSGGKITEIATMPAEVARQVGEYVLVKVKKGRREFRVILAACEVSRPCPSDLEMWNLADLGEDRGFFRPDEIKARRMNQALELPKYEDVES